MIYDIVSTTMAAILGNTELGHIVWSDVKGLCIALLINCIIAPILSFLTVHLRRVIKYK